MPLMPIRAKSTLNWLMKSAVAWPTTPPSLRTLPPAISTSKSSLVLRMLATCRSLVMIFRSRWLSRARAIASVVVPILMNSEAWSGMRAAMAAAMRNFSSRI